ncbi:hypothetical protein MBLNU457_6779t1 [Dothideomycetes sp. NU457]
MKVTTTLSMMSLAALSAAMPQFQVSENATNTFICTKKTGLAAYCDGDIIIRCNNGVGHAANCNDNLANQPPFGDNGLAGCYQSSESAGDAACTKAGLVYPSSGSGAVNYNNTMPFPIPGSLAGSNVTTSVQAGPASATGDLGAIYTTVWTTSIVVTNCNGTDVPQRTAAPALGNGHHWANATIVHTVLPAPVTPSPAPAPVSTTAAAARPCIVTQIGDGQIQAPVDCDAGSVPTSTQATTLATSSTSVTQSQISATATYKGPVLFTGAAAASRPASLSFVFGAAVAAYALL